MATLAVLWAVALVSIVLVALQGNAFREAASGREALARSRAYWAARAGLETQIAKLTLNTLTPDPSSALTLNEDLKAASRGQFERSSYLIQHTDDTQTLIDGPLDAHSRINVNLMTQEDLMTLDSMDEGVAAAIIAWHSSEDAVDSSGAAAVTAGAYESLRYPYKARQAPFRSIKEIELVTGVLPALLRGEDSNYNNILDPGEDDADLSLPLDNADAKLDQGWSRYITAVSEQGGYGLSGRKRIDLRTASAADVASRLRVDATQAQAILDHVAAQGLMADFVRSDLSALAAQSGTGATTRLDGGQSVQALSTEQLKTLLDEATTGEEEAAPRLGKININTVSRQTLERFPQIDSTIADTLISERDARSGGFVSLADLLQVPSISRDVLAGLMSFLDVHSNVFVITSRGRDSATGIQVEIVATVDRSSIPVIIRDLVVR